MVDDYSFPDPSFDYTGFLNGLLSNPKKEKVELVKHLQNKLAVSSLSDKVNRKLKKNVRFKVLEHL